MQEAPVSEVLGRLSARREVVCCKVLPARAARCADYPSWLEPRVRAVLESRGITRPYSHQVAAWTALREGRDVVVATPTASGKSLCYHAPVLDALVRDPTARALYLFPTKALARDQIEDLRALGGALPDLGVAVYDGDTPADERRAVRGRARIVATNPDMLHAGILPHHDRWAALLAGLRFVVVDELHTYRGVFGSHVANVLRRLRRVAGFHGAAPRFGAASATIANPGELGEAVLGSRPPPVVIADNGAASGERTFVVYNPPVVDSALGIRQSYLKCAERITRELLGAGVKTLVFARSRQAVEILVRYLRDHGAEARGYRAGYLPDRRRQVERELRAGETPCVVATSALELGIDVGGLDAVVITGWPGSRAAAWQQAGRAGRRGEPSLTVLVASSEPLDQYVAGDPEYLFGRSPEHARVDPDNPAILMPHLRCAAFELPFEVGEAFGVLDGALTETALTVLCEEGVVHPDGGRFHWVGETYPANQVALRGPIAENFVVIERADGGVLAEVDADDAPLYLHPNAIYQLEGRTYQVARLEWEAHKAWVDAVDVDHYTDAIEHTKIRVLTKEAHSGPAACGEVHITRKVVGFKKIKYHTHENVGYGEVALPAREVRTRAAWFTLAPLLGPEQSSTADAARGSAYALHHMAALLLMCDGRDLQRAVLSDDDEAPRERLEVMRGPALPTVFLCDRCPGGTGLAEKIYEERLQLASRARALVAGCACKDGCPACIGAGRRGRRLCAEMLATLEATLLQESARAAS
jgi:DEAD/DEAH box helicase domain-containing protein